MLFHCSLALSVILGENNWIDRFMSIGESGLLDLLPKIIPNNSLKEYANLPDDIKLRGVSSNFGKLLFIQHILIQT